VAVLDRLLASRPALAPMGGGGYVRGMNVRLRPLQTDDARTSVKWRNIPEIWALTGNTPGREITLEDELAWIERVTQDVSSRRFAIVADDEYVGNIYLTEILDGTAEYHIFIGERQYWGKGVAREASLQIIEYARHVLQLRRIKLKVRCGHSRAVSLYESLGFTEIGNDGEFIEMALILEP
jgi:RimJ/RimL family protein N-acetyltransferase